MESTAKKAFDFISTVDSRRLSTLVYHSAVRFYRLREVQPVVQAVPIDLRRVYSGSAVDQQATHYVCSVLQRRRGPRQPPDSLAPRPGVGAGGDAAG
eukprot:525528-Pyramimonas_sp.AAC.1